MAAGLVIDQQPIEFQQDKQRSGSLEKLIRKREDLTPLAVCPRSESMQLDDHFDKEF